MMETKVIKYIVRLLVAGFILAGLPGCQSFKDIKVTSCSLVSLTPKGFRSADAVLALGVDNPAAAFTISDLKGEIVREEGTAATFSAGTVNVDGKTSGTYYCPCSASINKSVSILELASLAAKQDFSGYKMNIEFNVSTKGGIGKTLHFDNIEISELVNR